MSKKKMVIAHFLCQLLEIRRSKCILTIKKGLLRGPFYYLSRLIFPFKINISSSSQKAVNENPYTSGGKSS